MSQETDTAEVEVEEVEAEEVESDEVEVEPTEEQPEDSVSEQEEESDGEPEEEEPKPEEDEPSEDEFSVTLDEDSPPQEDDDQASWVNTVRKKYREAQKENKELKKRLEAVEATEEKPVTLPKKPKIEDFDYDSDEFEKALDGWYDKKREFDEYQQKQELEAKKQQESWQQRLDSYGKAKESLKAKDFDFAEEIVAETLTETQQAIIIKSAKDPAVIIYALGKNKGKAGELSSITDPLEFAAEIGRLETKLKVNKPKKPPAPEKKISGTGSLNSSVDKTLERLEAEAERTGNRTKVIEYKRKMREA